MIIGEDKNGAIVYNEAYMLHDSGAKFYVYYDDIHNCIKAHLDYCPDSALENSNGHIPIDFKYMEVIKQGEIK